MNETPKNANEKIKFISNTNAKHKRIERKSKIKTQTQQTNQSKLKLLQMRWKNRHGLTCVGIITMHTWHAYTYIGRLSAALGHSPRQERLKEIQAPQLGHRERQLPVLQKPARKKT